jgi:hypothetical protein
MNRIGERRGLFVVVGRCSLPSKGHGPKEGRIVVCRRCGKSRAVEMRELDAYLERMVCQSCKGELLAEAKREQ